MTPKNGRARFQFLPEPLAKEVLRYSLTTKGQLLFPSPSGYEMTNNVLNRAYGRLAEEAGIPRITCSIDCSLRLCVEVTILQIAKSTS